MVEPEKDKRLDDLLDSLLSQYSQAEPRPGLETRILAHVKEAEAPPGRWQSTLRWLAAGAAGAAVAVVLFILFSRTAPRPQPSVVREVAPPVSLRSTPPAPVSSGTIAKQHVGRNQAPRAITVAARREVFPSPSPLSEQEALFLQYLAVTPREELIAQSHPDEPPAEMEQDAPPPRDLTQVPQRSSNTQ
jgi:hypothetical protein